MSLKTGLFQRKFSHQDAFHPGRVHMGDPSSGIIPFLIYGSQKLEEVYMMDTPSSGPILQDDY